MIDLLATRPDTDPQARACARLLTAVIADSIRSIGAKPSTNERRLNRSEDDARVSLNFLFNPSSPFEGYCRLIGLDAEGIRRALKGHGEYGPSSSRIWTESERRHAQARIRWFFSGDPMLPMEPRKAEEPAEAGSLLTRAVKDGSFTRRVSTEKSRDTLDGHGQNQPRITGPFDVVFLGLNPARMGD
jgi:hypothetical protein